MPAEMLRILLGARDDEVVMRLRAIGILFRGSGRGLASEPRDVDGVSL